MCICMCVFISHVVKYSCKLEAFLGYPTHAYKCICICNSTLQTYVHNSWIYWKYTPQKYIYLQVKCSHNTIIQQQFPVLESILYTPEAYSLYLFGSIRVNIIIQQQFLLRVVWVPWWNPKGPFMKRPAAAMECERPETRVACLGDSNTVGGGLGRLNLQWVRDVEVLTYCFSSPFFWHFLVKKGGPWGCMPKRSASQKWLQPICFECREISRFFPGWRVYRRV